jgi:hypothetical protein
MANQFAIDARLPISTSIVSRALTLILKEDIWLIVLVHFCWLLMILV